VQLALPELGRGWVYYPPMARQLRACLANSQQAQKAAQAKAKPARTCTQQERLLGLCD